MELTCGKPVENLWTKVKLKTWKNTCLPVENPVENSVEHPWNIFDLFAVFLHACLPFPALTLVRIWGDCANFAPGVFLHLQGG